MGRWVHGAPGAIRTRGTRFRRAVLYPLSYGGVPCIVARRRWRSDHADRRQPTLGLRLRRYALSASLPSSEPDEVSF